MKNKLLILMLLVLVASCASPKKFVYLNDMEPGVGYKYDSAHEAVIDRKSVGRERVC